LGFSAKKIYEHQKFITAAFKNLPRDPYVKESDGRFKTYSRLCILPFEHPLKIHIMPPHIIDGVEKYSYNQGSFNPDQKDVRRWYTPVDKNIINHPFIQKLVQCMVRMVNWNEDEIRHPIFVGIHLIKTIASLENPDGIVTPNYLHQDGHKYSFVHLIHRNKNCGGGENYIGMIKNSLLIYALINYKKKLSPTVWENCLMNCVALT
jgi:hypothetical protein